MADPARSALVNDLAEALAEHAGVETDAQREIWQAHGGLVRSNLAVFEGFVGDKGRDSADREWQVLYRDIALQTWLSIESKGIVHSATVEDKTVPGDKRDVIWVEANTLVVAGGWPQTAEADWLSGPFTRAGDFATTPTRGTAAASTGIFCGDGTPYGCTRKSR